MGTAQHTASPWRVSRHGAGRIIVDDCGNKIAEVATARHLADFVRPTDNADFIVRASNAHDDLVTALRGLQANPNDPWAHRIALDALAKATGSAA